MAPAIAVLAVFYLVAIVQVFVASFQRFNLFTGESAFIGMDNYRRVLASEAFWQCSLNAVAYLLITPALVVLSLSAALILESGIRWAKGWRLLLFLPVVTPTIVGAIAWSALLREDGGVFNAALSALGFGPVRWLTERPWSLLSPMLVTLWKGFGFYMMIFLAALLTVPAELKEAARLDGAGRIGVFRHVVVPAIWPVTGLVIVMSSISALKVFEEPFVTVRGAPIEHQTIVPLLYREAFERGDFGRASAIGVLLFLAILTASVLNVVLSRRRAAASAEGVAA